MIKIITVCGNGIGSSLMLKMRIEKIAKKNGISVDVESSDSNSAVGKDADLYVTVKEFENIFLPGSRVAITRSYIDEKIIEEDVLPVLINLNEERNE